MPETNPPLWKTLARSAILVGLVGMLAGLAVRNIVDGIRFTSPAVLGPLAGGAALLVIGVLLNLRWLGELFTGRKFLIGLNVWAMVVLSLALLFVANAIVAGSPQTYGWFIDCTGGRLHTLSRQTDNILSGLKKDVTITVLMGTGEVSSGMGRPVEIGSRVKDLVSLYRSKSGRIKPEVVDCYLDKTRAEQVALRLKAEAEPDSVVVECEGRHKQIPFRDMVELPQMLPGMEESPPGGFKGEEKLTGAIVSVAEEKQATVYFLAGHGEQATEGAEGQALNRFAAELKRDNYRVATLNLAVQRAIPADCDVLVIAGPTAAFHKDELDLLRGYLEKNGKIFALLKPRAARGNIQGLDALLSEYNVRVRDDAVVIEVVRDLFTGRQNGTLAFVVQDYGSHPVVKDLATTNSMIQNVCPVNAATAEPPPSPYGGPPPASPYAVTTLMRSGPQSWGETNLSESPVKFDASEDEKGPVSLAVAVERRPPPSSPYAPPPPPESVEGPRLVVVGSTAVAEDDALTQYAGNLAFVMNSVNWLAKKESKIGIPPQAPERRELRTTPAAMKMVFLITVLAMPLACILAGGFVWWMRRR